MMSVRQKLLELCDEAILLPSVYTRTTGLRLFHKIYGSLYVLWTGLKFSNYVTGEVEFSTSRVLTALQDRSFDGVLFEYWHAYKVTQWFRAKSIPCMLDMHDILWRSYSRQLQAKAYLPAWLREWMVRRYQSREEAAWNCFDLLIAINRDEMEYARRHTRPEVIFFHVPMGTDISTWMYDWQPALNPRRVAYYGGLGSPHNQQDVLLCHREIMPIIWETFPDVELWVVGSNPPAFIKNLERDKRIHVTGFVERPQEVLKTMSLVLCPWSGTYGFRSRIVEVMSLGVPVVASREAVFGMDLDEGHGLALSDNPAGMAALALRWLSEPSLLSNQSKFARQQVERRFSYEVTYTRCAVELLGYMERSC